MFVLVVLPILTVVADGAVTYEQLKAPTLKSRCVLTSPGHVSYTGESSSLFGCLDQKINGNIDELRITSGGGEAWKTLQTARALQGRLDLIVVEGICASSCANYLLPVAKRVRIEPKAYVFLHGSLSRRDLELQRPDMEKQIRAALQRDPMGKMLPETEVARIVKQTMDKTFRELDQRIPIQDAFAREILSCSDWLDIHQHFGGKPPAAAAWLLVTPEMARRCLKSARIDGFWAPEAQSAFDPKTGIIRALR
jgi:hypothetical protein